MSNIDLKDNQKGLLGLDRGSLEMGQADLNNSIRKVKEVIEKCQGLRAEASGIEDGGAELSAKMGAALSAAQSLLSQLSGVQGYVVSKEAGFNEAERKSLEALSKLGIMSGINDIQAMSESYYDKNKDRIETTKASVSARNVQRVKEEKAEKYRAENPIVGNLVGAAADVSNALVAVGGGLGTVVEDLVDFVGIVGTGAATPFTALYDYATGSHVTQDMWQSAMSFVAEEHVQNAIQSLYAPGGELRNLNIYAHDAFKSDSTACQVINGIGYVGGTIALALLTGGTSLGATAIAKGGSLAVTTAAKIATKAFAKRAAVVGAAAGFGSGTEEYWANVRDSTPEGEEWRTTENLVKGLAYGAATGAWEGVQWYTGIKLSGVAMNPAARVAIDSIFNAGDTPFRASADATISGKSFEQAFAEQGGWEAVGTNFAIGLIPSIGGEMAGLTRIKGKGTREAINSSKNASAVTGQRGIEQIIRDVNSSEFDRIARINPEGFSISDIARAKNTIFNNFSTKESDIVVIANNTIYDTNVSNRRTIASLSDKELESEVIKYAKRSVEAEEMIPMLDLTRYDERHIVTAKENIIRKHVSEEINLSAMSDMEIENLIYEEAKKIETKEVTNLVKGKNADETFETLYLGSGRYGIDQGMMKEIAYTEPEYYNKLIDKCVNEYKLSEQDAIRLLSGIDEVNGVCSYADLGNKLFLAFKDNPEEFERQFGFPLYRKTQNGHYAINDGELLLDMYFEINHSKNGGFIIKEERDGNRIINVDKKTGSEITSIDEYMNYLSYTGEEEYIAAERINKYFQAKSSNLRFNVENITEVVNPIWRRIIKKEKKPTLEMVRSLFSQTMTTEDMQKIKNIAAQRIKEGKQVSISVSPQKLKLMQMFEIEPWTISFIDTKTGDILKCDGGHIMTVTEVIDEGFIVDTWGRRALIKFSDLQENGIFEIKSYGISISPLAQAVQSINRRGGA